MQEIYLYHHEFYNQVGKKVNNQINISFLVIEENGGGRIRPKKSYRDSLSEELTFELRSKGPNFLRRLGKSGMWRMLSLKWAKQIRKGVDEARDGAHGKSPILGATGSHYRALYESTQAITTYHSLGSLNNVFLPVLETKSPKMSWFGSCGEPSLWLVDHNFLIVCSHGLSVVCVEREQALWSPFLQGH